MIYILNKNKTCVIFVQVVLEYGHTKKRPGQPETARDSPEQPGNIPGPPGDWKYSARVYNCFK
jgi:hypothetical protein